MESLMKKRIVLLLILLIAGGALFYFKNYTAKQTQKQDGVLKLYGTIDIRDLSLAFNEQERIFDILVEEGTPVTKGQILAHLNSAKLKTMIAEAKARVAVEQETVKRLEAGNRPQEIDQAHAEVEVAQAQTDNIQKRLNRLEQTGGTTSKQDLDDAKALLRVENAKLKIKQKALALMLEGPRSEDIIAAHQRLAALQASLELLNIRLADMTLTAPENGIILNRILEPGELAGPQRPVLTMALTTPKWVRAYVSEPDLGKINLGQQAQIFSDSFPNEPIAGSIGFISPVAEFTPRAVQTEELRSKLVYNVRVLATDKDNRLRLGMPVTVQIQQQDNEQTPPQQEI
jgi:HlyD family secretion protein